MPFGLTNAPRVFQRYMNNLLKVIRNNSAVYLDDVLIYAPTIEELLAILEKVLQLFRKEGLTLNLAKCSFLLTSINFLGFEIGNGHVQPGMEKLQAVRNFAVPTTVHQVRQFLGLTGFFRHFVCNYAILAKPLTLLTRQKTDWQWGPGQQKAFEILRDILTNRPILALFDPGLDTEVHCDASMVGLAGILFQRHPDDRLHPVYYYSRQTLEHERKYHSYELETLAVVESLKKFRPYLLGITFTVITDCNSMKATHHKKHILPRIARWWLQLQEFTFDIKYRPGERMAHVDALSRNPCRGEQGANEQSKSTDVIMRIETADWILAGQLTDQKIQEIYQVLSKTPTTAYERRIHKDYVLRNGRIYRQTEKGLQWVVPRGMRHQVVRAAHDELGHFAVDKTLARLHEQYWFPKMRNYVDRYISCCIPCLYNKRVGGRKEGFLHPIPISAEPINTLHVDHLGPFPKSQRSNMYILVGVDAFTKFVFLRAVRNTQTKYVIDYFKDNYFFATYGTPKILISDRGSCFTAKKFQLFCEQNHIRHVLNAVAIPRANGQVERLNGVILNTLKTLAAEEERWDEQVRQVQFAINNTVNESAGKTPSQLLLGFKPRQSTDAILKDEIVVIPRIIDDLIDVRCKAAEKNAQAQAKRKTAYDRHRKAARLYQKGDLVLVERNPVATGSSRKLQAPFVGPMIVQKTLPNDRYVLNRLKNTTSTPRKTRHAYVTAADKLRPWCSSGGNSSSDDADYNFLEESFSTAPE